LQWRSAIACPPPAIVLQHLLSTVKLKRTVGRVNAARISSKTKPYQSMTSHFSSSRFICNALSAVMITTLMENRDEKNYIARLMPEEKTQLQTLVSKGKTKAYRIKHAQYFTGN
jgi:hypothetical protein